MLSRRIFDAAITAALVSALCITSAQADLFVERNTNAQGITPLGEFRGKPATQDNESSCAINPLLIRNFVCAWNASGGSVGPIGDTWIRVSETINSGEVFENRYMNGSQLDPLNNIGQDFAADPITLCWPGGCGIVALASKRAPGGGTGGAGAGIYMQLMPEMNREIGFRHELARSLTPVYLSDPGLFADKPYAIHMLEEENPGTVTVSIPIDTPNGIQNVEREWPKAKIVVAFALGDPAGDEIKILSTYTEDYGSTWSSPIEISSRGYWIDSKRTPQKCKKHPGNDECKEFLPSGLNQGINLSAIGKNLLYVFRVFEDADNPSAIQGIMSNDGGQTLGEIFDIVSPFCAYDVPTLPNAGNSSIAASRTNATPWATHNGLHRVLVYAERKLSPDGGCFTSIDAPTDSRIKAIVGSVDGMTWSNPVEIAPNPGHGFQFQPVVECSLGDCLAAWWDSRFDTARVTEYLTTVSTNPKASVALEAFLNLPVLGDFNYLTDEMTGRVIQFRRTARLMATNLEISSGEPVVLDSPPAIVSKYRRALVNGVVEETQRDGWNIKGYRSNTVSFMGDYSWLAAVLLRPAEGAGTSESAPRWEDNRFTDPLNPDKDPLFWLSFATSRNVVGDIYTARITDPVPYSLTPESMLATNNGAEDTSASDIEADLDDQEETRNANSMDDSVPPETETCAPALPPGPGEPFFSLNNRTKDFDIYGAIIENRVSAFSLNPTKTYNILRAFALVFENETTELKSFRAFIRDQPNGAPTSARASFDQLPFDPADPAFATTNPNVEEIVHVGQMSSEARPVFVVSTELVNPVTIDVYEQLDGGVERFIDSITVNGAVEAGEFINEDGQVNAFERHDPQVFFPDEFSPDEFSPDEYSPDEFSPDVYSPDEFSATQFNPDEFSPDEFSPDEFSPDEFSPDEFSPDEFSPDEFSSPLIDEKDLDNPEIPKPELGILEGEIVAKKDINYGIQNIGTTITPYTMDFEVTDPEILALLESGELVAQAIAWQDKKINDVQFCEPRLISENRIISATSDIDLTTLQIPDIVNNSVGALTVTIAPNDVVQVTLRFIAKRALLLSIADKLTAANISTVFGSQVANTGDTQLITEKTIIIDDRTPPSFPGFLPIDSATFEADGPGGVFLPADFVQAERGTDDVTVECLPSLPRQVGLDINNSPEGPTIFNCTATTGNGVTAGLELSVFVLDTKPPTITPSSVPDDMIVEAKPGGTTVWFREPDATDHLGVDPVVDVACDPAPDDEFPFVAPNPTITTVECVATDDSMNDSAPATFNVKVQDTSPPLIGDLDPPNFTPNLPRFVLGENDSTFELQWGPFSVLDAGSGVTVECTPGDFEPTLSDPDNGLYVFSNAFLVDTTDVICKATDEKFRESEATFSVTIFDETPPTITLLGDAEIMIGLGDTYVDPGVNVSDNSTPTDDIIVDIDTSGLDVNNLGQYTVVITATDASGKEASTMRTVNVGYASGTDIRPSKMLVELGSSNALFWGWLDQYGNLINVRRDTQILRIREGSCMGPVVFQKASDSGSSGFRFKNNNEVQFNWQVEGQQGQFYCAEAESSRTGQRQHSPLMEVK